MGNAPSSGNAQITRFLAGCPQIPPTPGESEVLAAFQELLSGKAIPAAVAAELTALESLDTKWMYVFLSKLPAESVAKDWLEPRECVLQVFSVQQHDESVHELFCAIRINIILRSRDWVEKFLSADGVTALVALIHGTTKKANSAVHDEVLNVFFALAAFDDAVDELVEANGCCTGLLSIIEHAAVARSLKIRSLKLLAFMCQHNKPAREIILNAIISTAAPGERRFRSICQQFAANADDSALQLAVVSFVNALLASIASTAHRVAIREDLAHHGLLVALSESRARASQQHGTSARGYGELVKEIDNFLGQHRSDLREQGSDVSTNNATNCTVTITPGQLIERGDVVTTAQESATLAPKEGDDGDKGAQPETPSEKRSEADDAESSAMASVSASSNEESPSRASNAGAGVDSSASATERVSSNQVEAVDESTVRTSVARVEQAVTVANAQIHSGDTEASPPPTLPSPPQQQEEEEHQLQPSVIQSLMSQLESKQLDTATRDKITRVLQALVESLSLEPSKGAGVVDQLERSLFVRSSQPEQQADASPVAPSSSLVEPSSESVDPIQRSRMRLLSGLGESSLHAASPEKASVSKPPSLFQSFENFFSGSPTSTPAKPTTVTDDQEAGGGTLVCGSPLAETGDDDMKRTSIPKLTLPFFQSFRRGPGLGATPASTPIATASVRKDAKRHSFAAFASAPMPSGAKDSLTQTPVAASGLPTLALTPLVPAIESSPSLTGSLPTRLESVGDANVDAGPTTSTDVRKFRKLLAMGDPREAVRAKMVQAGVDPALLDEKQGFEPLPVLSLPEVHPAFASTIPAVPVTTENESPPAVLTSSGPDVSKFRKLLSMGAPLAAVKAKMVQAGLDPALLDQKVGFTEPAAAAVATPPSAPIEVKAEAALGADLVPGSDVSKFKKLLSMGAPLAAVKAKMVQAGVDPALLDGPLPTASPIVLPPAIKVLVKDDPEYAKFFKLHAMGAPAEAVKAKMHQAGLNSNLFDTPNAELPDKSDPSQSTAEGPPVAKPQVLVKDDPEYTKFFKLLAMGAPAPVVKAKMQMAGLKPELLDTPDAVLNPPAAPAVAQQPLVLVKDNPEYAKFFKLLSMGAPAPTVKAKMQMAGLKPELLDTPDAVLNPPQSAESKPQVLVKDSPEYAKFFKLLAMGASPDIVKAKMQMAGLKPELLDTPDAVLTPATAATESAAAKPAAPPGRRAHLAISIKPPVKPTTRSFYWQQLRGDVIKGTIWEEIEKESSGQNNDAPLVLSDSELAVLETEFPPPQAANGPGTRGRTNSIDHTATGPASPLASPRVVFLIDRSRANNISIIIKQFRISNAALREAVMKLDASVLSLERVQGLLKIMPTEEEIAAITGFQGDPLTLNEAERILKELISVPRLKQRMSALQAKLQFPTLVRDLQAKVMKLRTASLEISQSSEFRTTLSVVLQVGNKMNKGTNRGDAKGFRLGDLPKLAQLKSVDKAVTLLHFVARMIRLKRGNLVRLSDSLASLYDVQNIPIPELQGDMSKITEVTDNVGNELSAQKLKNSIEEKESCDQFVKVMDEFMDTASTITAALKSELDSTLQLIKDTMTRFDKDTDADEPAMSDSIGGPPSAASMAGACEFFSIVYEFSVALVKADRENELRRLKEERQLKLQQQKSQLPVRSHSSVDLLSGLPGRGKGTKASETAGPETPDRSLLKKDGESKIPGRTSNLGMSPVTRSVSMSAIVELKPIGSDLEPQATPATAKAPPAPSKKATKTSDKSAGTDKSKLKKSVEKAEVSSSKPPQSASRSATRREEPASSSNKAGKVTAKDKSKSKAKTMMAVPGKIIKATKQSSTMLSPLKIAPTTGATVTSPGTTRAGDAADTNSSALLSLKKMANSSIEKGKRRAGSSERIVPFDDGTPTLEEIRNKLERKHSSGSRRASASASAKPEMSESETDLLLGGSNNNSSSSPSESPEKPGSEQDRSRTVAVVQDARVHTALQATAAATATRSGAAMFVAEQLEEHDNLDHDIERSAFLDAVMGNGEQLGYQEQQSAVLMQPQQEYSELRHRRLAAATLSNFRAVEKKGMRGFLEGGTFFSSSPSACAAQCAADAQCLSFDFETVTLVCYISHTDRYAHPEAFLDFATGVYYEWQGVIAAPELEPNGGLFVTQIAARFFTNQLSATIYYRVEPLSAVANLTITADGLFGAEQKFGVATNDGMFVLPPYSCKVYAMAVKDGMVSSAVFESSTFSIFASKYAFLVPYFNGQFHGRVVRLKLDVKGKKRPRPARFLEFSDYESENGIGPYSNQVSVVNLTALNPDFKGFYGGLTGFAQITFVNETYNVPATDDANYKVLKWRLVFEPHYTPHAAHVGFGTPARVLQSSEYLYLAPYFNGVSYLGTIVRIPTLTFSDTPFIEQLNLTKIDPDLKGFGSSFTDGTFAYFVPRENESGLFGKMVRIHMDDFSESGTTVLDLAALDARFVGFSSAYTYNGFAYLVPMLKPLTAEQKMTNLREFPVANSGLLVRVNLNTFSSADALDLTNVHPELVGFSGAVGVANYAYMVPYMRRRVPWSIEFNPYASRVARVDLRDFRSVAHLDLAQIDSDLRGFMRGFAYKQFVFFVPSRSKYYTAGAKVQSGKVARLDTTEFSLNGVSVLDLAAAYRSQVPDRPDEALCGFSDGFVSGKYGFFVPYFDGTVFSGKVCRINLHKFDEVQVLDLTQLNENLRGFSGGILSKVQESLDTDLFGEFEMRQGTTTPYEYVY